MQTQRHPSLRVTPVEVGEPLQWISDGALDTVVEGTTDARGRRYRCVPVDDVWLACFVCMVPGHGVPKLQHVDVRYCLDRDSAMQACQDAEHRRAWELLPEPARQLLLGHGQTVPA